MSKNSMFTKAAAGAAGLAMAFSAALPAGAVTIAELQAQIAALMAQLSSLQGGSTTATVTFTRDLTVGSSGADVTALQQTLVAQGYLTMPAGTAFGYFGTLTKSAVARWQAAVGLPATGYFGTLSRAKIGASATGGVTTGGTTTGGTTTGGASGTITTPGAEGTITVTSAPVSDLTLAEGETMDPVLAFNVKAVGASDMAVQRVKLDLGNSTSIYNKILSRVYLTDDQGRTLASADLNSTNVVKDGSNYFITLSGFSSVVPKGSTRTYTVKADLRSTIDTADVTGKSYTVNLAQNGVRAVDGAGIDSYGPSNAFGFTFTVEKSQITGATLTVSQNVNTPASRQIVASSGSNEDQADKVVTLVFDAKATKDSTKITSITASTTATGSTQASTTVFYLYAGTNTGGSLLGTATPTVANGVATYTFDNLSYSISKDATQAFTIATDIRNANTNATTLTTTVYAANIAAENSVGDTVSNLSGSAISNSLVVVNAGPEITLNSKTITKSSTQTGTSTAQATFNITLKAVGGDVSFDKTSAFNFAVYNSAGTAASTTAVSYTTPSSGVLTDGDSFLIQEGNSVTLNVDVIYTVGPNTTPSTYSIGLVSVLWGTTLTTDDNHMSNFMSGRSEWRTNAIVLP